MEYGINNKIKYTTLQIISMLVKNEINRNRRKRHRHKSPQGGWGMGSKEPIPKMILLQQLQYQRTNKSEISWSLYMLKPSFLQFCKNKLRFFSEKGDPWGDLNAPETTSDSSFLFFLSDLINESEWIRITNAPNHFKSAFGSAYCISKN